MQPALRDHAKTASTRLIRGWLSLNRQVPILRRVGKLVWEVLRKYHRDDCLSYAASLSFFIRMFTMVCSRLAARSSL